MRTIESDSVSIFVSGTLLKSGKQSVVGVLGVVSAIVDVHTFQPILPFSLFLYLFPTGHKILFPISTIATKKPRAIGTRGLIKC